MYWQSIILFLFIATSHCEDNTTKTESTTTSPAVSSTTPEPIIPTDKICKICQCKTNEVICLDKGINDFFTTADWLGIKDLQVSHVDLRLNNFTNVSQIPELPIERLDLSRGQIITIARASFKLLPKLRVLDLSHNKLTRKSLKPEVFEGPFDPTEYQPLKAMRSLNLSYNQIHSLDQDVFESLEELEELHLQGNPLSILDFSTTAAIVSLSYLKILDLKNCQLKELPVAFLHTPRNLEWLDLSHNEFTVIPPPLEESKSLQFLSLSYNPIKKISNSSAVYKPFPHIPTLTELHLCNMPVLDTISSYSMSGLTGLKKLYMNHNPALTYIDPTAFQFRDPVGEDIIWPPVEEIFLDHNNLSVIDSGLMGRWDLMKTIDIQVNPFLCDCDTQWMVDTLAELILKVSANLTSDIICHEPIEMRGRSLIHLEETHRQMRCLDKYGSRPERDTAILIGTFIGVLIAIPTILGILYLHRRGYFASCGMGGPASFSRAFYKRTGTEEFM